VQRAEFAARDVYIILYNDDYSDGAIRSRLCPKERKFSKIPNRWVRGDCTCEHRSGTTISYL